MTPRSVGFLGSGELSRMKQLKIGVTRKNAVALGTLVDRMIKGATGQTELLHSPVSLSALSQLNAECRKAAQDKNAAKAAWHTARTARATTIKELHKEMKRFAYFAYVVFGGDKAKLEALGLGLVEPTGPIGTLAAPSLLRARTSKVEGSVRVLGRAVRGAIFYTVEYTEDPNGEWTQIQRGPQTRYTCAGLTPGKVYYFRMQAWGTSGPGIMSDITSVRAR